MDPDHIAAGVAVLCADPQIAWTRFTDPASEVHGGVVFPHRRRGPQIEGRTQNKCHEVV